MDLSNIQDLLDTFSTFAGAIGDFLKLPVVLLDSLLGADIAGDAGTTSSAIEGLSSAPEADNGAES